MNRNEYLNLVILCICIASCSSRNYTRWYTYTPSTPCDSVFIERKYFKGGIYVEQKHDNCYRGAVTVSKPDTFCLRNDSLYYKYKNVFFPLFSKAAFENKDTCYWITAGPVKEKYSIYEKKIYSTRNGYYIGLETTSHNKQLLYRFINIYSTPIPLMSPDAADAVYFDPKLGIVGYQSFMEKPFWLVEIKKPSKITWINSSNK